MYEGEVTEMTPQETENPLGGYGKTIAHVVIGLKTVKGNKQLKLDPIIYESLQKEKVEVGDVIYIESNTGSVKVCNLLFSAYQIIKNRELEDPTSTLLNSIWKLKNTFHYPKVMYTRRKKSFKMLPCMI